MCVLCASAAPIHVSASMNYSSTYKGAGRGGYIYTTSSAQVHSIGSAGGGMAQAPVASMSSTGSLGGRGVSYRGSVAAIPQVSGITTSASSIRGGVTTSSVGPRKAPEIPSGACPHCQWVWVDDLHGPGKGGYVCSVCGCEALDGCDCDPCHCDVPLDFNGAVALFMALLTCAYALYKVRVHRKETL